MAMMRFNLTQVLILCRYLSC